MFDQNLKVLETEAFFFLPLYHVCTLEECTCNLSDNHHMDESFGKGQIAWVKACANTSLPPWKLKMIVNLTYCSLPSRLSFLRRHWYMQMPLVYATNARACSCRFVCQLASPRPLEGLSPMYSTML